MSMKMNEPLNEPFSASRLMPTDSMARGVLQERAEILAKQAITAAAIQDSVTYIRFRLGEKERYGIAYDDVSEVMNNAVITKVPDVPNYIAGVVNRRGMLITVVDLRQYFQVPSVSGEKNTYIIVVSNHGITVGILVDNLESSDNYDPTELVAPLHFIGAINPEYILGLHHGTIAILDMNQLLLDCEERLKQ